MRERATQLLSPIRCLTELSLCASLGSAYNEVKLVEAMHWTSCCTHTQISAIYRGLCASWKIVCVQTHDRGPELSARFVKLARVPTMLYRLVTIENRY